ncbi:hypothetical protein ERJ75_000350600 [Trypanosoma vivax]|uniref:Fibrous sheath-interacting protein 1 n=1 Tax=Trypanosoma vivax (strain Y486) TaxID=1055687 RepID=G0TVC4_TRYVY|nr:hypothetical protein TRVL_01072 [Trypanosoma vivax]KAH8617643.1 hypothetical protein ERJ75_000350600 [Trypanosoma vivax]CCC47890.1 conserved hypothetical protein [Trypanosoma vivax Y486]
MSEFQSGGVEGSISSMSNSVGSGKGSGDNCCMDLSVGNADSSVEDEIVNGMEESAMSSLASRMLLHTLANRVMITQLDDVSVEMSERDVLDDSDDTLMSSYSQTAASLTPSLSITSIVRAEQLLQKTVPLVNGGQHITLTKEDVGRLRDSKLLHFLEANSPMFVKHLHKRGITEHGAGSKVSGSSEGAGSGDQVQDEASAFVTVYDSEGVGYRICMGDGGRLLVPVSMGNEEEVGGVNMASSIVAGEQVASAKRGEATSTMGSAIASSGISFEGVSERERQWTPEQQCVTSGRRKEGKRIDRRKPLCVRGVGLTAEDDQRIAELLNTDFAAELCPYTAAIEQQAALDERLRWFQEIRGPLDGILVDLAPSAAESKTTSQVDNVTAKSLGDGYMQEVRERRLLREQLRSLNTQLKALQRQQKLETLRPAEGVEHLVGAPRPSWSKEVPQSLSEEEINKLLATARLQDERAVARGEKPALSKVDAGPTHLQTKLRLAVKRVESMIQSHPQVLEKDIPSLERPTDL